MILDVEQIKALMLELGMKPLKQLGQNFLVSERVIQKIAAEVKFLKPKNLLEIGPGLGALTRSLVAEGLNPTLIEFDKKIAQYWREQSLQVIEGDALRIDWAAQEPFDVLVSNLPYQISSSLLIELSIQSHSFRSLVLMFQKEVAQRIIAKPKTENYGLLSVIAQLFWEVSLVSEAGPKDFWPQPKIASRVLRFDKKQPPEVPSKALLTLVKAAFHQRRKKLSSNLKTLAHFPVAEAFDSLGIKADVRAEELSPAQFVGLAQFYSAKK